VRDGQVEQPLGAAHRARPQAQPAVVQHVHGDLEALAPLAEHVLGRDAHPVEVQLAQVVAAQAHRVEAVAGLEALHALLDDEGGVLVLAGLGERHQHARLAAVADVVLHAVKAPGAV